MHSDNSHVTVFYIVCFFAALLPTIRELLALHKKYTSMITFADYIALMAVVTSNEAIKRAGK